MIGFIVITLLAEVIAWLVMTLFCKYKYLYCKGECMKCHNWKCRLWHEEVARDYLLEELQLQMRDARLSIIKTMSTTQNEELYTQLSIRLYELEGWLVEVNRMLGRK